MSFDLSFRLRLCLLIRLSLLSVCKIIFPSHALQTFVDPEEMFANDPMTILKTYMKAKNLRLFDLFRGMDKDGSKSVTREEFKEGIRVST